MLEARKENKVYQISEQQKDRYLKEGFDIYEDGNVIEYTPLKKIKYSEHLLLLKKEIEKKDDEIAKLNEELANAEFEIAGTVLELLIDYAKVKQIDIGSSTSAKGVLEKILEAEKEE